jgi:hypothetical protein
MAPPSAVASATSAAVPGLPSPAPVVPAAELAKDAACGVFNSKDLSATGQSLLRDRVRVAFFSGGKALGDEAADNIRVRKGGASMFVGAREMYQTGDVSFERHAAKLATFKGDYDAFSLAPTPGRKTLVAGALRAVGAGADEVSVAHGWFLDAKGDVLDVAVFVSRSEITDLASCRLLAQKILNTASVGPRTLTYGAPGEVETKVTYAKFRYRLGPDWILADREGIHDFAHVTFRKRTVFPLDAVRLTMGLDAHPGEWTSPGSHESARPGRLLGMPVQWQLTADTALNLRGAWAIAAELTGRDHAVATLYAPTPEIRDEAIRFAESVSVGH